MIAREALIADFQTMLRDRWGYIPATAGEVWTQEKQDRATSEMVRKYGRQWVGHRVADCSGAFVWAYRQHGLSIYHGSNRIARKYVKELLPIAQARPGMAAFKARRPGEQQYDLPAEYRQGGKYYTGDLNDYYHIGLIDTDPRYVLNSRSTASGFVRSKLADGWDYVADLKAAAGGQAIQEDTPMRRYVKGGRLNLRKSASTGAAVIAQIPDGAAVTILNYGDAWCEVEYNGKTGWAKTEYLAETPAEAPEGGVLYEKVITARALLANVRQELAEADRQLADLLK